MSANKFLREAFANQPEAVVFDKIFNVSSLLYSLVPGWNRCYRWLRQYEHFSVKVYYGICGKETDAKGFVVVRTDADGLQFYLLKIAPGVEADVALTIAKKINKDPASAAKIALNHGLERVYP